MLRTPLSRSLYRQFTTSAPRWNVRPPHELPQEQDTQISPPKEESSSRQPIDSPSSEPPPLEHFSSSSTRASSSSTPDSKEALSQHDLQLVKQRIREWTERAALSFRHRADDFTASTKVTFSKLGSELNKVTGYEEIEALKRDVAEREARMSATRQASRQAKAAYQQAVIQRSNSQREVNEALARKSFWKDSDVGHFTTIVKQDHLYEQEEARAKAAMNETEDAVEREFSQLIRSILARYHEEQMWSDKIRSASTYGQLAVLGLNLVVFIMAIVVVEPWKRRRLAQTFEKKVEELSEDNAMRLDVTLREIGRQMEAQALSTANALENMTRQIEVASELRKEQVAPVVLETAAVESATLAAGARRDWELTVVGTGAFLAGVVGCFLLGR